MELKRIICPICGSNNFIEINNIYRCKACDTYFEKHQEFSEREIELYSSLYIAESFIRMTPPRFDLAEEQYKIITKDFPKEAIAWWGLFRAKNNIKYINGVPICYEYSNVNIKNDSAYMNALQYAKGSLFDRIKNEIEKIVSNIKEWENREKDLRFDVFLSFKYKDEFGNDTPDTKVVKDLYDFLVSKGLKVFFAPETMKKHIGEQVFDAYIYNALANSKALLIYGSKSEYFESDWIVSEWTRYLNMISIGKKTNDSLLIVYKNFNAYDLPRELKKIQAYDGTNKSLNEDIYNKICKNNKIKKSVVKLIDRKIGDKDTRIYDDVRVITKEDRPYTVKKIIISDCVKAISIEAFSGCSWIEEIIFGNGIEIIGDGAFRGCSELNEIIIPDSVKEIGGRAFDGCWRLKYVRLSNMIDKIASETFQFCRNLENIIIPEGVKYIGDSAFWNCKNLKQIKFPSSVQEIGMHAFSECKALEELVIPITVKRCAKGAFNNCSSLKKVSLLNPELVIDGWETFYGCINIREIFFGGTIEEWKNNKRRIIDKYTFLDKVTCIDGEITG